MVNLPRVLIAAPSTGQGKTTIATGLMAALRSSGLEVSGHKVGPDYIDPGYHGLATGRPGRNLDPHLVGPDLIAPLLLHGAREADVAVIEGVMGLYDGKVGRDGFSSSAHVATLTRTPVVLVMDVARLSRTAGAIAAGMVAYDPSVSIAGVILNRAGSARNVREIERSLRLPVLGVVPRDERLSAPSRHLGLVPVAERGASTELIELLGEQIAAHVDLSAVMEVARAAPDLDVDAWTPPVEPVAGRPVIAVAGGRAFTFRYPETEELLTAAGCDVVPFDPLADPALPDGTQGIYLGGGFPEVYAAELASNGALMEDVRDAVAAGIPTVAECAGLLYLAATLDGTPMVGAVVADAAMAERLTLRYPEAVAAGDSLLTRAGEVVTGHEFHRTETSPSAGELPAWIVDGDPIGWASPTLHASYLHTHWAGNPQLAQRFAAAAAAAPPRSGIRRAEISRSSVRHEESVVADLSHHGDVEATDGLMDFAVNVYAGPRPTFLDDALSAGLVAADRYPDPTAARQALAKRHGRTPDEVLPTSGASEAFELLARVRSWRRPVVIHPGFTEPHAALIRAGRDVTVVQTDTDFRLRPERVPADADLVVIGNPTNPTGVLHPVADLLALSRPGRMVVVDEAFMDVVRGETNSLARPDGRLTSAVHNPELGGIVIVRSLTKHWSIPGIRAGYVLADPDTIAALADLQTPWSVSTPALAAMVALADAGDDSDRRAADLTTWTEHLTIELRARGIRTSDSRAPYVLAQVGRGVHAALRDLGIAVRRADTFPGLDPTWVRIAARPPEQTAHLLTALDHITKESS
jgi:cobyrinic acid a,c-diamide synthase